MMKRLLLIPFLLLLLTSANGNVINVPADYSTIQAAINASTDGDTIAVATGTYYENINFGGKKILLTSLYYISGDTSFISSTIINGSAPVNPDTASCVIFNSGEDTTAVLQGFTLTGGTGTKWLDIHGAGTYREGGGILIELCSPKIRCNIIRNNMAMNVTGVVSAGGGGIRIGDGNPILENNLIISNQGRYGAGIVLNYTGVIIRNNIIASNTGGSAYYGGSGIWITSNLGSTPKIIENNTIVNNYSSLTATGTGGILSWTASNVIIRNNILWGNLPAVQVKGVSSTPSVSYCDIQGGYAGTGNFSADPYFEAYCYVLTDSSPCIDAGDTAAIYNDNAIGNVAVFPSKGTERNDVGAFGGPHAFVTGCTQTALITKELSPSSKLKARPNPFMDNLSLEGIEYGDVVRIYNAIGLLVYESIMAGEQHILSLNELSNGIYFLQIRRENKISATLKVVKQD